MVLRSKRGLGWAVSDLWAAAGDGDQGRLEVGLGDNRGSGDGGDGSGGNGNGGELHYNERRVVGRIK